LAGDLNATNPVWNSQVSNASGEKLLNLLDKNDFQITTPQYPTHYTPQGNGDALDIVLTKSVRLPDVTVSDILESDHLPTFSHILDNVKVKETLNEVEIFTHWERFQSLASESVSPTHLTDRRRG
jgi:hypothetical protein